MSTARSNTPAPPSPPTPFSIYDFLNIAHNGRHFHCRGNRLDGSAYLYIMKPLASAYAQCMSSITIETLPTLRTYNLKALAESCLCDKRAHKEDAEDIAEAWKYELKLAEYILEHAKETGRKEPEEMKKEVEAAKAHERWFRLSFLLLSFLLIASFALLYTSTDDMD